MNLAGLSFLFAAIASGQTLTLEVVPPTWITPDGVPEHRGEADAPGPPRAFVFPSLGPHEQVGTAAVIPPLVNFFGPRNRFRSDTFRWQSGDGGGQIELAVERNNDDPDATISIKASSESSIRRLNWADFNLLQAAFVDWLFDHTNCGLLKNCESRYTSEFRHHLRTLWKSALAGATFGEFAVGHLNLSRPTEIAYSGDVQTLRQISANTRMFLKPLVAGQQIVVTWGNDNFYPSADLSKAYSRITSGGSSEFRVVSAGGMRVFPRGSCSMEPVFQQSATPAKDVLTPIPPQWSELVNTEFVPVYNRFDLSSRVLLSQAGAAADCTGAQSAPQYLFLLTPGAYLKADPGGAVANTAQFENEARDLPAAVNIPRQNVQMLARQFFLFGCDSPDPKVVQDEWNHLIEIGFNKLRQSTTPPPAKRTCGNYVNALFAGRSFVEVRNSYSINGRLVESGARDLETLGQAFAEGFAARLNREGAIGSPPLVEVVRYPNQPTRDRTQATAIRLRFHTTVSEILDQVYIDEGDEIRARFLPEDLR
jgi:hypothetical protein